MTGPLLGDLLDFLQKPADRLHSVASRREEAEEPSPLDGQSHEETCMYDALSRSLPKQLGIHTSPPVGCFLVAVWRTRQLPLVPYITTLQIRLVMQGT